MVHYPVIFAGQNCGLGHMDLTKEVLPDEEEMPDTYKDKEEELESEGDEDEDRDEDDEDQEYNLRMFGIARALPVLEGEPDWSTGMIDASIQQRGHCRRSCARGEAHTKSLGHHL